MNWKWQDLIALIMTIIGVGIGTLVDFQFAENKETYVAFSTSSGILISLGFGFVFYFCTLAIIKNF